MTTNAPPTSRTPDAAVLQGRSLRFVLVNELMNRAHTTTTVAQLVHTLAEQGYRVPGRASKVISDALRWEVRRHRVERLGRGCYRYRCAPETTARRIKIFAARCHAWVVATMRGQQPPLTPPDPRARPWLPAPRPEDPPWAHLGWLWVT